MRIAGRVQGVGFRDWTFRNARKLNLVGWVRNEPDDHVVALIAGDPASVEEMLRRLREGPANASVSSVETANADGEEIPPRFRIVG